jgi:hypothetical protein
MSIGCVCYVGNQMESRFHIVAAILAIKHWPLHVYGQHRRWRGFGEKLLAARQAASELVQYDRLLFIDAFDVIVMAEPCEVEARYDECFPGLPYVSIAERNCWPDPGIADRYPYCDTPWRYVNAGAYIAEREYLRELHDEWGDRIRPQMNDQAFLTEVYLENAPFVLDVRCELFQSLHGSFHELDKIDRWEIHNRVTDTWPLICHHHGGADIREGQAALLWRAP